MSILSPSFPTVAPATAKSHAGASATIRREVHRRKSGVKNVAKRAPWKSRHEKLLAKRTAATRRRRNRRTPHADEIVSWWRLASLASLTALATLMAWFCLWIAVQIWGLIEIVVALPQLR